MDGQFMLNFLQIMLIDLVLSSDNAVVIGLACRGLPKEEQQKAIIYGTFGAILLRISLTGMTTWMLDIPLLKAIGGCLLLWISYQLLTEEDKEQSDVVYSKSLVQAVKTIILADFIMSLDNVLAVGGAAHGNLLLVLFGLGFSIPLLMWGSTWIARLMDRFSMLIYLGSAILAYTATEMCLEDPYVWKMINPLIFQQEWLPMVAAILVMALGKMKRSS
ncbi:TerC family protein [Brevibacillus fulvus]|uniref:YjbE family integral membrane protein n=1 Tax=Brevibacillus fulvus TaxID=1125967 RepID=A0A938Y4D4_9BACL|nr:TerC family protein [Brevibacillus fulvus]MBM7591010.1 YjbE family integral membrane protein [Brevibacillus fulvus]